jgi:hypothetical protein
MLQKHPSEELQSLFHGYQGQDPAKARVIFLGLDANFSPGIMDEPESKELIREYLKSGPDFCENHKVHHPFVLSGFPAKKLSQGIRYHQNFKKLELFEYINEISFLELLRVATCDKGEKEKTRTERTNNRRLLFEIYLDHLRYVDGIIKSPNKLIFFCDEVVREMNHLKKNHDEMFDWLPTPKDIGTLNANCYKPILIKPRRKLDSTLYKIIHLSYLTIATGCEKDIHKLVAEFLKRNTLN